MMDSFATVQAQMAHQQARRTPTIPKGMNEQQARKVAEDFEAFFLAQAFQPMFASIEAAEPFGGGQAEQMWRGMQVDEMGKAMAKAGGVGIADAVYQQILRMQEVPQ